MSQQRVLPRVLSWVGALAFLAASGCNVLPTGEESEPEFRSESLRDLTAQSCPVEFGSDGNKRSMIESFPFCELEKGEGEWICENSVRKKIDDITKTALLFSGCDEACQRITGTIRVKYKGEIDKSFLQFIELIELYEAETINDQAKACTAENTLSCDWQPRDFVLIINSPGGDVEAAIDAARIMSLRKWTVLVKEGAECTSACIFLLASAAERIIIGSVGIHRIIPVGSSIDNREALEGRIAPILDDARSLLKANGVSPRLLDDMMTIPSSEVRFLTKVEIDEYGLGAENSAALDLERVAIERKCGADFAERLIAAEALSQQCGGSTVGGDFGRYRRCMNAGYKALGFPDRRCPDDGPDFMCVSPQARSDLDFEPSKERCE